MVRQLDDMMRSANDRLLNDLLEVVDNFERALKHANEDSAVDESKLAALKGGTELIYNQLAGLLARYDIKPIESVGLHFDPKYHEALVQVESDVYDEGIVAAEINIGYMIGERILRHARVAVSIGSSTSEDLEKNDV
jgi:molecular chaperone GrpE